MTESAFKDLEQLILQRLTKGLDRRLTYHNPNHTLDVLRQAERIAQEEGVKDEDGLMLLRIAALYHDTGFLDTYQGHEQRSCEIMREDLEKTGLNSQELDQICGMIMATKIPQSPTSLLEEILCDADLDYLGRPDFPPISQHLMHEFLEFGIIKDEAEWDPIQIGFFEKHQYFTRSSRSIRQPGKLAHLALLKSRQASLNQTKNIDGK